MTDSTDHVLDQLVAAFRSGAPQPAALAGQVAMIDAYAMQVRLLRRLRDAGARHTGWKIGQTNAAMRAERGETEPAPGFLLADVGFEDAGQVELAPPGAWFLEPEIAFVLARPLQGPGVTADDVARAVASTHAAFELVKQLPGWSDRALLRAVNGTSAGYVLGASTPGCPDRQALDALRVRVERDGAPVADVRGGEVNDNPLASTAWLASYLATQGEALLPGQVILTGSYTALLPLARGQSWHASLGSRSVALSTI